MWCRAASSVSLLLAGILLASSPSWASMKVRVVAVHEGDRLTIYHDGKTQTVYLQDIDCPELKQPYGKQAKRATTAYVGGREVIVRALKPGAHGRTIVEMFLPDGRNVGHELVKEGLAWSKRAGSPNRTFDDSEELARASGKGLWADPNPVPPWKWKSQARMKH